jgi:hypothetical protein
VQKKNGSLSAQPFVAIAWTMLVAVAAQHWMNVNAIAPGQGSTK